MAPDKYVRRFRTIAAISRLGFGIASIVLMLLTIIPRNEFVPAAAVIAGSVPIVVFKLFSRIECPRCKAKMKRSSKFPNIVYTCPRCSHIVNASSVAD